MYSYFYGKIVDIDGEDVIIDVHDVGYSFRYTKADSYRIGAVMKVYLYHVVREDEEFLVGFTSKEERNVFEKLISVKGIGPKTAISALGSISTEDFLKAIETSDVNRLKKLPGVGSKAASQIILDLKGKLVRNEEDSLNKEQEEATLALKSLGFKTKEIQDVLKKLPSSLSVEELIRESLRRLRNNV